LVALWISRDFLGDPQGISMYSPSDSMDHPKDFNRFPKDFSIFPE